MILTINEREFTLTNVMNFVRTQPRERKQIGTICRGPLFCGYFGGISGSGSRSMTRLPAPRIPRCRRHRTRLGGRLEDERFICSFEAALGNHGGFFHFWGSFTWTRRSIAAP
jgi:hypothetical protein